MTTLSHYAIVAGGSTVGPLGEGSGEEMIRLDYHSANCVLTIMRIAKRARAGLLPREEVFIVNEDDYDKIIKSLEDQLSDHPGSDGDLVDYIADIIMRSDARNILTKDMLRRLRTALLTPRELEKIRIDDLTSHKGCSVCGETLQPGELTTISSGGTLSCHMCTPVSLIRCAICRTEYCHPTRSFVTRLRRYTCEACKRPRGNKTPDEGITLSDSDIRSIFPDDSPISDEGDG